MGLTMKNMHLNLMKILCFKKHTDFISKELGFVISSDHPFIGVSLNGIAK